MMNPRLVANYCRRKARPPEQPQLVIAGATKDTVVRPPGPLRGKMEYLLQVDTTIRRKDMPQLVALGPQLVKLITDAGLTLQHSCWQVSDETVKLHNLWSIGTDADALTDAELSLPDKPAYARFDRFIVEEVKNLVVPLGAAPRGKEHLVPGERYVYFRVNYRVDTINLSEFDARLEASLHPFAIRYGWVFGDTFLSMTGRAGSIMQLWAIPESSVPLASARLAATPWQELVEGAPVLQWLEPTPTDPVLGQRNKYKPVVETVPARSAAE